MRVLIDSDVILYQSGFSTETPIWRIMVHGEDKPRATFRYKKELLEWATNMKIGEETYDAVKDIEVGPVSHALSNAKELIKRVILRTGADEYTLYLTGKGNFREEIATILPYKGNRDGTHKPHHYDSIKRYLKENWGAQEVEGIEADDAMATTQMDGILEGEVYANTCIATIDKDLNMIPGWHYNWNKDILYFIDEDTAIQWFYCQLIMGDTVDNIRGIQGAGKKKTYQILSTCKDEKDMYWEVLKLYDKKYDKPMEALMENAHLLWMIREEGVRWKPPV